MKIISANARSTGRGRASEETAEAAAADIGELAGEVLIIRWMLATLLAVAITGFGVLGAAVVQILLRLP